LQAASVRDNDPIMANLWSAGFKLRIIDYTYQRKGLEPYPSGKRPVNSFTPRGPECDE